MTGAIRSSLARRAALAAVARREPRALTDPPEARSLLIILPADEPGQRAGWALIGGLALRERDVYAVVAAERIHYTPDRFAGAVPTIGDGDRDWRRLPRRSVAEAIWARRPDVALNLADVSDLGAAVLVGASPAALRIGRHEADLERFYDLMVAGDDLDPAGAVGRLLAQLDPPVLPLRSRADTD